MDETLSTDWAGRLAEVMGEEPRAIAEMSGGCVSEVFEVTFADRGPVVAKVNDDADSPLACEAWMLQYLATHSSLPVPAVLHTEDHLLVMTRLPGRPGLSDAAQQNAAEQLAALHQVTSPDGRFGLERETVIGGLPQSNNASALWVPFFAEQRLCRMAECAQEEEMLPPSLYTRCQQFAAALQGLNLLQEPTRPALLHGDCWGGNILADGDHVVGWIDPAIYYGHPEMELAFGTLFGTLDVPFFERYNQLNPIADEAGFWAVRRHVYNLYPLLVHVRLFGGGYVQQVDDLLRKLGY